MKCFLFANIWHIGIASDKCGREFLLVSQIFVDVVKEDRRPFAPELLMVELVVFFYDVDERCLGVFTRERDLDLPI